jgi:transposase
MNDNIKKEIALFRYAIIAPLVTGTYDESITSKEQFFRNASKREYLYYNDEKITVSAGTIKNWYLRYQKKGYEGLVPKNRSDVDKSRKLDSDITEQIKYLKTEYPKLPATIIYNKLIMNQTIRKQDVSLSTITRFINNLDLDADKPKTQYLRYEKEHINEVWYGDTSHISYALVDGKKMKIYLIALLDDHSRMITGYGVYTADNYINVMQVMKSAVIQHGLPKVFTFDNGSNYKNKQMDLLAAHIGTTLNYPAPYTPTSKSKIERFFKTFKAQCLSTTKKNETLTLKEVKTKIANYINEYNNRIHSSLNGLSPCTKFFNDSKMIKRLSEETIEKSFLLEIERKVSKDNIVKIDGIDYEVDYKYSNQRIILRYTPDLEEVYVVNENGLEKIKILNKHTNSKIRREKNKLIKEID